MFLNRLFCILEKIAIHNSFALPNNILLIAFKMRTFVLGDIHGAYAALMQCLQRSGFDYQNDLLIQLGDVVDGYPESFECVEELLKIKNLIAIKGNHDEWLNEFIKSDFHPYYWTYGGEGTLISYLNQVGRKGGYIRSGKGFKTALCGLDIPLTHQNFFANQKPYFVDVKNRCFIHAGFDRSVPFYEQQENEYYDNRSLWKDLFISIQNGSKNGELCRVGEFSEVYVGHTPTTSFGSDKPLQALNVINIDTGAGHCGRLTIMDVNTKEYWQSNPVPELYELNFRKL